MWLKILRAEDIGVLEQEGGMDPFVRVVYDGKEVGMTHIARRTINPTWDCEVRVPLVEAWDMSVAYITLEVKWNDDSLHSEYVSICRANLSLMQDSRETTLLKCQLLRGSTRRGFLYVEMRLEDHEVHMFSKVKRIDVREILPPHNDRFHHHYAPIPRVWHPLHDCIVPSNERVLYILEEVSLTFHVTETNQGVLALMVLTTFRLWFIPYTPVQGLNHEDVHTIPLGKIAKIVQTQTKQKQNSVHGLTIESMDASFYSVTLNAVNARNREADISKRVRTLGHIVNEIEWLQLENNFCAFTDLNLVESHPEANVLSEHPVGISPMINRSFLSDATGNGVFSSPPPSAPILRAGSSMEHFPKQPVLSPTATSAANKRRIRYDPFTEFNRQGVFDHPAWRKTYVNENYDLCHSYPKYLVVPKSSTDDTLREAARFRSKKRFPALTWLHPRTGAPLCRSSQPKSGLLRSTNKEDRDLLWAIRDGTYAINGRSKQSTLVHIVDCRPEINAKSNALAGKGHESSKHYDRDGYACASIAFMGIDNIHVVRASFNQLSQALYQVDDATFYSTLQKSRWLEHINSILVGATEVAAHLERGDAVLVHCSDGWDRTAQLCALAQLMLDPHFRTIEGFAILVEKDWCSFGHNFARRCGFPATDETSPVFQQFLDAVYQLTLQFPTHFQFNELFLSTIADAVYSSWYGTFQKNSEEERSKFLSEVPTISIWDTIRASTEAYRNPLYAADKGEPMLPVCRVRHMQLWTSQHQKAISHMRLQQREIEMLALIRQHERELTRLRDLLTPEQNLEVKNAQLRSEIQHLTRKIAIHHESLVPSQSFTASPATTPEKNSKLLRRITTVASPTNGQSNGSFNSTAPPVQPPDLSRTRSGSMRVKNGLAALLTGKHQFDLATLRAEYQELTRQLDELRAIAAVLDEEAYSAMQQLRLQCSNQAADDIGYSPEIFKDDNTVLISPAGTGESNTSSALSTPAAGRPTQLLEMTDFNMFHSRSKNGPRSNSVATSRLTLNSQPVWESDKDAACCKQCKKKFIAVVRNRHHCRCCGYVFCGKCTNYRMALPEFGYFEYVRVCRACYQVGGGEEIITDFQRTG